MRLPQLLFLVSIAAAPPAAARDDFVQAVQKIQPSVATVISETATGTKGETVTSATTGIVVSSDGLVLTAYHANATEKIRIKLADGTEHPGTLHGYDAANGLTVIKVNATGLTPAEFGDSSKLQTGQWVVSVGNQFGVETNPSPGYSVGIVGGLDCSLPHMDASHRSLIKTDATINPGCVGGPLVDSEGRVVGVNIAICSSTGCWQGVGYAIPSATVLPILEKIRNGEKIDRGWLGVTINPAGAVKITTVGKGTPAEKSGLRVGDEIVAYNGTKVSDPFDLVDLIAATRPGSNVVITVTRDAKEAQMGVVLGTRPLGLPNQGAPPDAAAKPGPLSCDAIGADLPPAVQTELAEAGKKFQEAVQHCFNQIKDPTLLDRYRQALEEIPGVELRIIPSRKIDELTQENRSLQKQVEELRQQLQRK